jgi:hypothetical protein
MSPHAKNTYWNEGNVSECGQGIHTDNQLLEKHASSVFVKSLCLHNTIKQLSSCDQLQHNVNVPLGLKNFPKVHNVHVVRHLHDGNFPLQLRFHVLFHNFRTVDNLDRPCLLGANVNTHFHSEPQNEHSHSHSILSAWISHAFQRHPPQSQGRGESAVIAVYKRGDTKQCEEGVKWRGSERVAFEGKERETM